MYFILLIKSSDVLPILRSEGIELIKVAVIAATYRQSIF